MKYERHLNKTKRYHSEIIDKDTTWNESVFKIVNNNKDKVKN